MLLCAGSALADNYQYRFVGADQAAARHIVLQPSDLPALSSWKGGFVKPDETRSNDRCNGYLPKESDLVVTGDKETRYSLNGFTIDTQASVFRSATMVATDWSRQPKPSALMQCFRSDWPTYGPKGTKFGSVARLPLHAGTHSLAFQIVFWGTEGAAKRRVRVIMDVVAFLRGRTEVSVMAAAPTLSANDDTVIRAVVARVSGIVDAKLRA